jgi:beta-lactamase regulating signal transducer with metallopeptidase domain
MTPSSLSLVTSLAGWLAVATTLSALVAVTSVLAHHVAGAALPRRVIWSAALFGTLAISLSLPLRRGAEPAVATLPTATATSVALTPPERSPLSSAWHRAQSLPGDALHALAARAAAAATTALQSAPGSSWLVLFSWPLATSMMLLVLALSYRRQRRLLTPADITHIAGTAVHVSEHTGPAVIGIASPAIVIPRWLLARSPEEQRLVVLHERSHVAARDPLLLLAGCAAVALMPWNLAAWWMLSRLRLAVELDCDTRVLAAGATPRRYGQLLIDLSAVAPATDIPLASPAFSFRASHLERRLRTMTDRPARFPLVRGFSAIIVTSAALLTACGAELPTATELQGLDVARAEARIGQAVQLDSTRTVYLVDGYKVAAGEARKIASDSIATIEIRKADGNTNEIRIATRKRPLLAAGRDTLSANVTGVLLRKTESSPTGAAPLIFLDGRRISRAEMDAVKPDRIQSVEVVKGAAAVTVYGPEATGGAVVITTRK